jgi:hypothetical protein
MYLIWAWIIIIGGLMITPGGIDCIVCGPFWTTVLGIVSIGLGVVGFVLSALGRRGTTTRRVADLLETKGDMHG